MYIELRELRRKLREAKRPAATRIWNQDTLACAASAQPLSYDNQTTTSSHNPLYVYVLRPGIESQPLPAFYLPVYSSQNN